MTKRAFITSTNKTIHISQATFAAHVANAQQWQHRAILLMLALCEAGHEAEARRIMGLDADGCKAALGETNGSSR